MASVTYTVSFDQSKAHYAHININFTAAGDQEIFKVPVWTPGSYKVREFSQNMENVRAFRSTAEGTTDLNVERTDKNSWTIPTHAGEQVNVGYDVYCFVNSVRHSYVDEFHAFLHGVSAFGFIQSQGKEEVILQLKPLPDWNSVEIAAERLKTQGYVYRLDNYDQLADSPIALGNFDVIEYKSGNVPHRVVMIGEGNYEADRIREDFKKISDEEVKLFGEHPSDLYIHFIQNTSKASGGLEHLNSQTSQMDRWGYNNKERYLKFLGLISHEYFHLWNVKRIRPVELGPFDYDHENYTTMLWIAEGITSYYDDLFLYRSGFLTEEAYFKILSDQINRYENTPGKDRMNLEQSSQLAWIKAYLPNENSHNTTISYYNKGMLVAWMLDLHLLKASHGKRGLDEVMQQLWKVYKERPGQGFTMDEFVKACEAQSGSEMKSFFKTMLWGTGSLNYASFMAPFGLHSGPERAEGVAWAGVNSSLQDGRLLISKITSGSPAELAGLSVNDELIALNGWRLTVSLDQHEKKFQVGDTLSLTISRDGKLMDKSVILANDPKRTYTVSAEERNALQDCWLGKE